MIIDVHAHYFRTEYLERVMRQAELPAQDVDLILGGNARALLGL